MAQPTDIQHLRLSKLFGTTVRDAQNENIGKLDNVMIDMRQGKLAYGIVAARHDRLGAGKDFVAVPWSALNWTGQPGIAKVNVDRQTLASLAFSRNNFPNLADPQYSRQLFGQFHATPYWESPSLGFIPGQENEQGNLPSSGMTPPNSGMAAPNTTAPNAAVPQLIGHKDRYVWPYSNSYNPATIQTFSGRVSKVITGQAPGTSMEELGLIVHANNGRNVQVDLGPRAFVEHHNMVFHKGDPVTVTGSLVRIGDRDVFVASQIHTPYRTLALRTPDGAPIWSRDRSWYPDTYSKGYGQGYDRHGYPYRY
jgi:sporulation protein YlmC with PRC-barrel domain